MDTSVIVTRYAPSDPNFRKVESFFTTFPEARYISEISILELYSVFSRLIQARAFSAAAEIKAFADLATDEKVRVTVDFAVRSCRLRLATPDRDFVKLPISRQVIEIPHELFEAIRVCPALGLRSLDALHLAYAIAIRDMDPNLRTFATLDEDLVSREEEIQKQLGLKILTLG